VSNSANFPPAINTALQQQQHQQQQQYPTDRDWQTQGSYSQLSSPLHDVGEADEYIRVAHPDSERDLHTNDPGLGRNNTIRQVQQDVDTPGFRGSRFLDSQFDQQRHQDSSQPQVQIHSEKEPQHFEAYEPQPHPTSFTQRAAQLPHPSQFGSSPSQPQTYQQQGDNPQLGRLSPQGNSETVSQFSHESPVTDSEQRPSSQLDRPSPAVQYSNSSQEYLPTQTIPSGQPLTPQNQHPSVMAPPSGGPPPNRRIQETDKVLRGQVEPPAGAPPGYRHPNTSANALSPLPPGATGAGATSNPVFRGDRPPAFDSQTDHGRDSPQPPAQAPMALDAEGEKAFKDLRKLARRKEHVTNHVRVHATDQIHSCQV
jgi:hypothetical protein